MNSRDAVKLCETMAREQDKVPFLLCLDVLYVIENYYNRTTNFYEEDIVNVFKKFLDTGVLCVNKEVAR